MKENHPKVFKQKVDYDLEEYKAVLLSYKREYALIRYQFLEEILSIKLPITRERRKTAT